MTVALRTYGIFYNGYIKGAISYSRAAVHLNTLFDSLEEKYIYHLARFWVSDDLPKNTESKTLALSLRFIQKNGAKACVSYADEGQGHIGTIYQACGFLYTGISQKRSFQIGDKIIHGKTLYNICGTSGIKKLRERGLSVSIIKNAPKHRYIKIFDPSIKLLIPVLPYPKKLFK